MENDPNDKFQSFLNGLMDQKISDLPVVGMEQLAEAQGPRLERLALVEERLADQLPEDDIRLQAVRRSMQRSVALQKLAQTRAERERILPKLRPHQAAFVGTVRRKNGRPAVDVRVALFAVNDNTEELVNDAVTDRSGSFAIVFRGRNVDHNDETHNLQLRVLNERDETLIESRKGLRVQAGRVDVFDIVVPSGKMRPD